MPDKTIRRLYNSILPQWKACFISAVVFGLIAHFYKLTNFLPNWDSIVFRYDAQNMLHLGRWFLPVATAFTSFYDLPFINGFIAILFYALGAVCICNALDVKSRVVSAVIGAVVTTFPAVTSTLMYNYVADGYAIAFFLSCFGGMCLVSDRPKYILGTISIVLSVGIYQAYVTVAVMLVLCRLVIDLMYKNADIKSLVRKSTYALAFGAIGMVLYYIVLNGLLALTSTKLLDYQGISSAGVGGMDIPASLYVIKETLLGYFFDFSFGINTFSIINIVIFSVTLIFYIRDAIAGGIFRSPLKLLFAVILFVSLPLGGTALAFINPFVDYHNLMLMGYSVYYIVFVLLYEQNVRASRNEMAIRRWIVIILSFLLIYNQTIIANVCYHKAQVSYEKSYGLLLRIADRIEQIPEAASCDEVLVAGAVKGSEAYSVNLPPDITGVTDGYIFRADDEVVGQSVLTSALNDHFGKSYRFVSGDRKQALLADERVSKLPFWPENGSIAVVDDVIVIKLGAESEVN